MKRLWRLMYRSLIVQSLEEDPSKMTLLVRNRMMMRMMTTGIHKMNSFRALPILLIA